jgi:tripartite ATP-independent transporter DctP family solute receptor
MKNRAVAYALLFAAFCLSPALAADARSTLRFGHVSTAGSITGRMATMFALKADEYSGGSVAVEVYPNSQLGGIQDLADAVSAGEIAFYTTTPSALGSLYEDFAVLDTPYLYVDERQFERVIAPSSPVMERLSSGLLEAKGLRVLGAFYFGARHLTCDRAVRRPEDLAGLKVRAIPYPVFRTTVEGLGAEAVPIDWAKTPTALAAKVVNGQENPVNTILSSALYESQSYLMLTGHQLTASVIVANEVALARLSRDQRAAISRAAAESCDWATKTMISQEAADIAELEARGMKVIGPAEGLDLPAFRARTAALVARDLAPKWGEYYRLIAGIK